MKPFKGTLLVFLAGMSLCASAQVDHYALADDVMTKLGLGSEWDPAKFELSDGVLGSKKLKSPEMTINFLPDGRFMSFNWVRKPGRMKLDDKSRYIYNVTREELEERTLKIVARFNTTGHELRLSKILGMNEDGTPAKSGIAGGPLAVQLQAYHLGVPIMGLGASVTYDTHDGAVDVFSASLIDWEIGNLDGIISEEEAIKIGLDHAEKYIRDNFDEKGIKRFLHNYATVEEATATLVFSTMNDGLDSKWEKYRDVRLQPVYHVDNLIGGVQVHAQTGDIVGGNIHGPRGIHDPDYVPPPDLDETELESLTSMPSDQKEKPVAQPDEEQSSAPPYALIGAVSGVVGVLVYGLYARFRR